MTILFYLKPSLVMGTYPESVLDYVKRRKKELRKKRRKREEKFIAMWMARNGKNSDEDI